MSLVPVMQLLLYHQEFQMPVLTHMELQWQMLATHPMAEEFQATLALTTAMEAMDQEDMEVMVAATLALVEAMEEAMEVVMEGTALLGPMEDQHMEPTLKTGITGSF